MPPLKSHCVGSSECGSGRPFGYCSAATACQWSRLNGTPHSALLGAITLPLIFRTASSYSGELQYVQSAVKCSLLSGMTATPFCAWVTPRVRVALISPARATNTPGLPHADVPRIRTLEV